MNNYHLYILVGVLLTFIHFYKPVANYSRKNWWWCLTYKTKVKDTLTLFSFTILLWPLWLLIIGLMILSAKWAARRKNQVQLIFAKHSKPTVF
jgi:uncharacterized membrane-anchored protein